MNEEDVCRCGHYRHLHLSDRYACALRMDLDRRWWRIYQHSARLDRCPCQHFRLARWRDEHDLWRHVAAPLWLALPARAAWWVIDHWPIPGRCHCDLVEAVLPIEDPERRYDYACGCDVPLPTDAGKPRPGWCYCPEETQA